jgi:hypothetical protein
MTTAELRTLLDHQEARLHEIRTALGRLQFQQYEERRPQPGMPELEAQQAAIQRDPATAEAVAEWHGLDAGDPLLNRRVELWSRTIRRAKVEGDAEILRLRRELANDLVAARYNVGGREMDLGGVRDALRKEPAAERRRLAWLSFGPLSQRLDGRLRQLMHLRNSRAREAGYGGYVDLALSQAGLERDPVEAILRRLCAATDATFGRLLDGHRVAPWDVGYLLEGQAAPPADLFPRSEMLPRLDAWALAHGLAGERSGISVHFIDIPYNGLTMAIDPPRDVRVLLNPGDGHLYYKLLWHEYGHALHATGNAQPSHVLRQEPAVFNEAMAESLAFFTLDPEWVTSLGADPEVILRANLGAWLLWLRTRSAHALFEYAAYDDPDADLDAAYAAVEARYLGARQDPAPRWAANAWFTSYPVYWQNYVLGDVVAAQIHGAMRAQLGRVNGNPESIAFLREHFWAPGGSVDWQEKLRRATGRPIDPEDLISRLG